MAVATASAGSDAPSTGARIELLREADTALSQGRTEVALERLERAAAMAHAADTELLMVRTWLQRGEFRRALAFSAHTAAAHRGEREAVALYRFLLERSGQQEFAQRVPGASQAGEPPVRGPVALAVVAGEPVPQGLAGRSTALLLDDARHAVTVSGAVQAGTALWVRNGLGDTVRVQVVRADTARGLALLRLDAALRPPAGTAWADRAPFGGSAVYVLGYDTRGAGPAWPQLHAGFLAPVGTQEGARQLGVPIPADLDGAPVFDGSGRVTGLAVRAAGGETRFLASPEMRSWLGDDAAGPLRDAPTRASGRIGSDDIYERALLRTLQVLALP